MAQSLSRILVHVIFSTKNRAEFLKDPRERDELEAYMATVLKTMHSPALHIGGEADHSHILCSLGRAVSIADVVGEVKRESSRWIKSKGGIFLDFSWQNGYGAFSVGQMEVEKVKAYIGRQVEHHRKETFQAELLRFLDSYGIEYDLRYLWD